MFLVLTSGFQVPGSAQKLGELWSLAVSEDGPNDELPIIAVSNMEESVSRTRANENTSMRIFTVRYLILRGSCGASLGRSTMRF